MFLVLGTNHWYFFTWTLSLKRYGFVNWVNWSSTPGCTLPFISFCSSFHSSHIWTRPSDPASSALWRHLFPDMLAVIPQSALADWWTQSAHMLSCPQLCFTCPPLKTILLFTRHLWFDVSAPPWLHYSCLGPARGPQRTPISPWWLQQWNLRAGLFVLCFNSVLLEKLRLSVFLTSKQKMNNTCTNSENKSLLVLIVCM